jgi:ribosomal protein S18 acetylase RimI-like enzyme
MNIRQATPADSLLLSSLSVDVQSLHVEHHPDIFRAPQSKDFAKSFFEEALGDSTTSIFIAEDEGESLGYILCNLIERQETPFTFAIRYLMIDQISVRPVARGRGVGAELLRRVEELAKEQGVQKIQLGSWDFNIDAHRFFERHGFTKFHYRFWQTLF